VERVIAYVDGFNLYFGMKSKGWRRYYWLNVPQLAQALLKPGQQLVLTKYFTSRVSATPGEPDKASRQDVYLRALATLPNLTIYYGQYLRRRIVCRNCRISWDVHDEKMTDVNISVEMLSDAFQDRFDTALLISGDSDLSGAVEAVQRLFPSKRVAVAFPPDRTSVRLRLVASGWLVIGRRKLALSQFPEIVAASGGHVLLRPPSWR